MSEQNKTKLFLSYGRRDAAGLANRLRTDLEKLGYEVWQDTREIRAGKEWEEQIADGLRSTQVVIALLSPHAVRRATDPNSPDNVDSVCLDELTFARFAAPPTPIVPVMAIPCEPPFAVFRLDYVSMTQWMHSEDEFRQGFERLVAGIEAAASGKPLSFRRWHHSLPVLDFAAQLHEKRRDFVGRQWLFDEIDAWRTSSSSERALLIVGDPGIGKSAFVAEMIHRNPGGKVLAYHICRADDPETLRPSTFAMSLAGMIAGRLPAFADLLEAPQFQDLFDPKTASGRPAHVFNQGLIAALHQLPAPPDGIRYLLIDALDEALTLGEGQLNIVTLLSTRLNQLPAWLRIVATTRREPDVLNRLSSLRAASIDAHRQDNLDDIDRFIAARLDTPNLAERLAASRVPLATVQHKLRDKADGNFLYVSQALQDIERDNYSFSRLDELPQGLSQWYEAWFARKFPNPKVDFVDARKVLEVILAAREPLTTSMIMFAASITDDDLFAQTMSELQQFVVDIDNRTAVYHKSLLDWLHQNHRYRVSAISGNRQLAAMCQAELRSLPRRIGMQLTYHTEVYCRFLLQHLAECGDWPSYRAVLLDDTLITLVFPLDVERGRGTWRYFLSEKVDWWSNPCVILPSQATSLDLGLQVEMKMDHAKFFFRAGSMLREMYDLNVLPDYGASKDRPGFRDACYGVFCSCSLGLDFLEQVFDCVPEVHRPRLVNELVLQNELLRTLKAIDTPRSTGLSGQLEDMTSVVIERWQTLMRKLLS